MLDCWPLLNSDGAVSKRVGTSPVSIADLHSRQSEQRTRRSVRFSCWGLKQGQRAREFYNIRKYLFSPCSIIGQLNFRVMKATANFHCLGPFSLAVLNHPGGPKPQIFMNGACSPSVLPSLPAPVPFPLPVVPDYR